MYPVGTFSVFTLKRTDTTLDLSQTAEKVRNIYTLHSIYFTLLFFFIMGIHSIILFNLFILFIHNALTPILSIHHLLLHPSSPLYTIPIKTIQ